MSRDAVRRYLVAYDIADDRRRTRIAHRLQAYGDRVQFSVFVVDTKPARMLRLSRILGGLIDTDVDGVLICDLGPRYEGGQERMSFLGRRASVTEDGPLIA